MEERKRKAVERTMAKIRRYLLAHPGATDTATGIVRWWLHEEPDAVGSLADVEWALERLEADGKLERIAVRDGRVAYRARS
ncbi:MAG TPA: hypothetical protein VLC47_04560 [Burkholderiales bacterium]|nr:hypothetical protein [Burkholderiales bacterium]